MADESYKKTSRCWPGYVPVPSKGEHEEGSCRKEPASKNGGKEVDRETARKKQIKQGGTRAKQAKGKSPDQAERRSVSKSAAKTAAKRAPAKKTAAKKTAANKTAAKKTTAKKSTSRRSTASSSGKKAAARRTQPAAKRRSTSKSETASK